MPFDLNGCVASGSQVLSDLLGQDAMYGAWDPTLFRVVHPDNFRARLVISEAEKSLVRYRVRHAFSQSGNGFTCMKTA